MIFTSKDFYATFDLIEVTLRMNLAALAQPLIAEHGPITSYKDLKELAEKLIDSFLTWEKFSRKGLRGTPNLASAAITNLHISPEVEQIVDLPSTTSYKRIRCQEEGDGEKEEYGEVAGEEDETEDETEVVAVPGEQKPVGCNEPDIVGGAGGGDDTYLDYVKG